MSLTEKRLLTRRQLLKASGALSAAVLLGACAQPATPAATTAPKATTAPAAATAAATKAATQAPSAATAAATKAAATPKKGGTITFARAASMQDFSGVWFTEANYLFIRGLYNTLIRQDKDFKPQPELAESWQFSPDGLTLTLKLRQGVKFHSGEEFTSENVKASFDFGVSEDVGRGSQLRQLYRLVKEVKMPDKYTVQLSSDKPNPMIWDILDTLAMFDKTKIDQLNKTDAGSGPFMVTSYIPNQEVRMKRFADYWDKTRPYVDEYVVRQIPDMATMIINMESKAVDGVHKPSFSDVARLTKQGGFLQAKPFAPPIMYHIAFNSNRKPFDNKKVRQAMSHLIDRTRFCQTTLQGTSEPTWLMFPKNSWAGSPELDGKYPYSIEKAKQLLTEAGFANGFETSLICSKQMMSSSLDLAQIFQADAAKVGVKIKLLDMESTAYNLQWRKNDWDSTVHTYGRYNRDPGTMLQGATAWYNKNEAGPVGFDSPEFVKLRDEAATTLDQTKRKELYKKIEALHMDECWSTQVAGEESILLGWDYVKDLVFTPEACPYMGDVWLNK
ncbi:MAG: ABC transporter substrate-binding protein [Chloroflexota bacterium]